MKYLMDHDLHATVLIDVLLSRGLIVFYSYVDGSLSEAPPSIFSSAGKSQSSVCLKPLSSQGLC